MYFLLKLGFKDFIQTFSTLEHSELLGSLLLVVCSGWSKVSSKWQWSGI